MSSALCVFLCSTALTLAVSACSEDAVPVAGTAEEARAGAAGATTAGPGGAPWQASAGAPQGAGAAGAAGSAGATSPGSAGAPATGSAGAAPSASSGAAGAGQAGKSGAANGGGAGTDAAAGSAGAGNTGGAGEAGAAGATPSSGPSSWNETRCPASGKTGFAEGDTLGALPVRDCITGAVTTIDALCGATATWLFAAHTHCPTCKATAAFTDDVAKAVAAQDVAIIQTVYDDNGTSCEKWASAYGLASYPNVRVFEDPKGAVWEKIRVSAYTAPSAFLDKDRKIIHKEHGMSKAAVLEEIGAILNP